MRRILCRLAPIVLLALAGCASFPQARSPASTPEGLALLGAAAKAHGLDAYQRLVDVSVSYDGRWFDFVERLQPVLVDRGYRGASEERLLVQRRAIGQVHRGPDGAKHVLRTTAGTQVTYNGTLATDRDQRAAAALVADGYRLFLLGPIYLVERDATVEVHGRDTIDGVDCDVLFARLRPGLGEAREDRVMLWIDRRDRLTRRMWISADGLATTQGVIAEIEVADYVELGGVRWPTRFFERLKRPLPIDVHAWKLTGLDLDRGFTLEDIAADEFRGKARRPAEKLTRAQ